MLPILMKHLYHLLLSFSPTMIIYLTFQFLPIVKCASMTEYTVPKVPASFEGTTVLYFLSMMSVARDDGSPEGTKSGSISVFGSRRKLGLSLTLAQAGHGI